VITSVNIYFEQKPIKKSMERFDFLRNKIKPITEEEHEHPHQSNNTPFYYYQKSSEEETIANKKLII
jgi:hypothetical protein